MEGQIDGSQDVAAVRLVPKDPLENNEVPCDDGGPEPLDKGWEDTPRNRVREGARVSLSTWRAVSGTLNPNCWLGVA